jgi:hypothetical protein
MKLEHIQFENTILSNNYYVLFPKFVDTYSDSLVLKDPNQIWNLNQFQTIRQPVVIGNFNKWNHKFPRILDCPIKFPNSSFRIPLECIKLQNAIQQIINFEYSINPLFNYFYCYLTIDTGIVKATTTQRRAGCHVDGFQGARINPKTIINRSYISSNCLPTVFYPHEFKTNHLDESKDNFFLDFDRQAKEEFAWRPNENDIVLSDAYCVHRCDVAKQNIYRTFFRLSFDVKKFDRLGNTHNPSFNYNWKMVTRDIQKSLKQ